MISPFGNKNKIGFWGSSSISVASPGDMLQLNGLGISWIYIELWADVTDPVFCSGGLVQGAPERMMD